MLRLVLFTRGQKGSEITKRKWLTHTVVVDDIAPDGNNLGPPAWSKGGLVKLSVVQVEFIVILLKSRRHRCEGRGTRDSITDILTLSGHSVHSGMGMLHITRESNHRQYNASSAK